MSKIRNLEHLLRTQVALAVHLHGDPGVAGSLCAANHWHSDALECHPGQPLKSLVPKHSLRGI